MASWLERNLWAEAWDLNFCCFRSRRRVGRTMGNIGRSLPIVGTILSGIALANDLGAAYDEYQKCLAG